MYIQANRFMKNCLLVHLLRSTIAKLSRKLSTYRWDTLYKYYKVGYGFLTIYLIQNEIDIIFKMNVLKQNEFNSDSLSNAVADFCYCFACRMQRCR